MKQNIMDAEQLKMKHTNEQKADTSTSASIEQNPMLSAASLKDGVGAYCNGGCGGIVYAVTDERMKEESAKKSLDWYWQNGYQLGRVSKEDVSKNWGCFCQGSR